MQDYIPLEWKNVGIASLFVLVNAIISLSFGLDIEFKLVISSIRCVLQLFIMGQLLEPIFKNESMEAVVGLSSLLLLLSVLELYFSRLTYRYPMMFMSIWVALGLNTFAVGILGNTFAVNAQPWYKPTQFIPIFGMLIGNSMSAIAVGLNSLLCDIVEGKEKIEILLCFGASRWEASRHVCSKAIKMALLPILNSQSVMGLISIPGMLAGQVLGGVPIKDAVFYQMVIMFMLTAASGLSVVSIVLIAIFSCFDSQDRIRLERITKRKRRTWTWDLGVVKSWFSRKRTQRTSDELQSLL